MLAWEKLRSSKSFSSSREIVVQYQNCMRNNSSKALMNGSSSTYPLSHTSFERQNMILAARRRVWTAKERKNVIHDIVQIYHNLRCHCCCCCWRFGGRKRLWVARRSWITLCGGYYMDCYVCFARCCWYVLREKRYTQQRESSSDTRFWTEQLTLFHSVLLLEWDNKLWNLK